MANQQRLDVEELQLTATADFPNNDRCPVLLYRGAFGVQPTPEEIEVKFAKHGWMNGWRAGVYSVHHYHSTAHEVLGCFAGLAELQLGGPGGPRVELSAGDVVVIPAGVSHKNLGSTPDFCVVGAYAGGRRYDMNYGKVDERAAAEREISTLPLPRADPVAGAGGPLLASWH